MWSYWINILDAVWQATVEFFVAYLAYRNQASIDVASFGFTLIFSMVIVSVLHVILQTSRIDWSVITASAFSILVFLGFTLIFDAVCVNCLTGESPYQVAYHTMQQGCFWFTIILTITLALLPRYIVKCVYNTIANPLM